MFVKFNTGFWPITPEDLVSAYCRFQFDLNKTNPRQSCFTGVLSYV